MSILKKKSKWIFISIMAVIVIFLLIMLGVKEDTGESKNLVDVYTVPNRKEISFTGVVEAKETLVLESINNQGVSTECSKDNGSEVKKDDLILAYYNKSILDQVEEYDLQLKKIIADDKKFYEALEFKKGELSKKIDKIKKELNNVSKNETSKINELTSVLDGLYEEKRVLDNESSPFDTEIENLKEKIELTKEREYEYIHAPFDGKIYLNDKYINLVSNEFQIKALVNEVVFSKLKNDMIFDFSVLSTGEVGKCKISYLKDYPKIDEPSNCSMYEVYLDFSEDLKITNGFQVQLNGTENTEPLMIPESYVLKNGEEYFVIIQGTNEKRKLQIDKLENGIYYVMDGIKEGETLINPNFVEGNYE